MTITRTNRVTTGDPKTDSPKTDSPKTGSPKAGSPKAGSPKPGSKVQRQQAISRLIAIHAVGNQPQLVDLLAEEGIVATQATVSRDLEDLGAVKVRVPGGDTVYADLADDGTKIVLGVDPPAKSKRPRAA